MLGQRLCSGNDPVIETGGVVRFHGCDVIPAEIIDEPDAADGIAGLVQGPENVQQILGDGLVADHLPYLFLSVKINIGKLQVTKL